MRSMMMTMTMMTMVWRREEVEMFVARGWLDFEPRDGQTDFGRFTTLVRSLSHHDDRVMTVMREAEPEPEA